MPKNTTICGLILVAGLSSRMGDFKPLLPLCGKTLIENTVDSMLRGGAEKIVVVTGYRGNEVEEILRNGCYNSIGIDFHCNGNDSSVGQGFYG